MRGGPLLPVALTVAVGAALGHVTYVVAEHTIEIVEAHRLLPRWDLATHLVLGWRDYDLLATGRIPQLLWDLWLQGYWPPLLSIYQVPFYLVLGGGLRSGLWSTLVAFALTGLTGCALLWRQWKEASLLPGALFLALLMSSPFLLAYASVTMLEIPGALVQLVVVLAYVRYRQHPGPRTARVLAVALTALFFTKYNYFVMLAVPLVLHEWLERTSGGSASRRVSSLWRTTRRVLSSPSVVFVVLYLSALAAILWTGGFDFHMFGRAVSVHTIGNAGHLLLYVLLARLWYLHRRGRIDWVRLMSRDPRIRPLLVWFVVPVTIWLASPYPNHIRDFAGLVFNRPMGEAGVGVGFATYLPVLRSAYFYSDWILGFVVVAFAMAAVRYDRQPPFMQVLILAIPMQAAVVAVHWTRSPRFLLLTVVLLCLAASSEAGRWASDRGRRRLVAALLAPVVLVLGVVAARRVVTEERFRAVAFENYTDSQPLRSALDSIRHELNAGDRLAIVGQSNELSPAFFRWKLGPPSGVACFPFELAGPDRLDLALATRVLLVESLESDVPSIDITGPYLAQRLAVLERVDRAALVLRRDMPLPDLQVALRLYERTSPPERLVACQ